MLDCLLHDILIFYVVLYVGVCAFLVTSIEEEKPANWKNGSIKRGGLYASVFM